MSNCTAMTPTRVGSPQSVCDHDAKAWNRRFSPALKSMLSVAGYGPSEIRDQLNCFQRYVTPHLGQRHRRFRRPAWHSFMTDNGTPIELSWSWSDGAASSLPAVRYSIEPLSNMPPMDIPYSNLRGNDAFLREADRWCTALDLSWHNLLADILVRQDPASIPKRSSSTTGEYESQVFWAFDLDGCERILKVYYVLNASAEALRCSKRQLVEHAISKLSLDEGMTDALHEFYTFLDVSGDNIDIEMLSFDCIHPEESRIKVYFRSRNTTFEHVKNIMSLGGRSEAAQDERSDPLEELWGSILPSESSESTLKSRREKKHRTAGMLYYCELKPRSSVIRSKVYIPVRHYGVNDYTIAEGISRFLDSRGMLLRGKTYLEAVLDLQSRRQLERGRGLHTYVSYAMDTKGNVNISTYMNPSKMKRPRTFELGAKWLCI